MQISSRITFMAWSEPSVLAFEHDENGKVILAIEMLSLYLGECIVPAIGSGNLTLPALQQDVPVPVTFIQLNQKVPVPFSSYDPNTLLTESVSVPGLYNTTYGYDARGRVTTISTDTRQSTFAYNPEGFLDSVTDPENHTTTYTYDAVGRVTGISRPDTGFVGFAYDENGNMTVLTNPVDINHSFGFNKVNRNSSYTTPLSGSYSYIYDKDRRLVQTNFPSGKQIFNIYDTTRLSQIQAPEGNIDFTYLCGTKIDSISKGSESVTYGYDGKLVTSETLSGTLDQSLSYTYNNDFDVSSFTYGGQTEGYGYDNDGLLAAAGNFSISRNAGNGLPEAVSGGTLNLARTFNGYGEVEGQSFTVAGQNTTSWALTRDNNGRITDKTETADGTTSGYVYTYDATGRLLTVTKDSVLVEEYQYDLNGTRTYEMNSLRGIAGRSYSYSDEDHLLSAGSVAYAYDPDGFLTTRADGSNITSYTYSSRGELLNVTLPDSTVVEYVHDPLGRRITKKVDGAITEKYLWQGLTRLLAVYDGFDNLLLRFEYADSRMPVAMTSGGAAYYLTYDQVGSLRTVADSAGNVVKLVQYDSFGNVISDSNPTFAVPFGFAGGLCDPDTELVRFGYRDYDPDLGRWTAKDPIFFKGIDTDLYGYSLSDPINLVDINGLWPIGLGLVGVNRKQVEQNTQVLIDYYVPELTDNERDQLTKDALDALDWGDVNKMYDLNEKFGLQNLEPPNCLNKTFLESLPPEAAAEALKFLNELPARNKDAIDKILKRLNSSTPCKKRFKDHIKFVEK